MASKMFWYVAGFELDRECIDECTGMLCIFFACLYDSIGGAISDGDYGFTKVSIRYHPFVVVFVQDIIAIANFILGGEDPNDPLDDCVGALGDLNSDGIISVSSRKRKKQNERLEMLPQTVATLSAIDDMSALAHIRLLAFGLIFFLPCDVTGSGHCQSCQLDLGLVSLDCLFLYFLPFFFLLFRALR